MATDVPRTSSRNSSASATAVRGRSSSRSFEDPVDPLPVAILRLRDLLVPGAVHLAAELVCALGQIHLIEAERHVPQTPCLEKRLVRGLVVLLAGLLPASSMEFGETCQPVDAEGIPEEGLFVERQGVRVVPRLGRLAATRTSFTHGPRDPLRRGQRAHGVDPLGLEVLQTHAGAREDHLLEEPRSRDHPLSEKLHRPWEGVRAWSSASRPWVRW